MRTIPCKFCGRKTVQCVDESTGKQIVLDYMAPVYTIDVFVFKGIPIAKRAMTSEGETLAMVEHWATCPDLVSGDNVRPILPMKEAEGAD